MYEAVCHHVSCIMYCVSCIMHHASCNMFHVSCVTYNVSYIMHHASCVVVSCITYQCICILYHVACVDHLFTLYRTHLTTLGWPRTSTRRPLHLTPTTLPPFLQLTEHMISIQLATIEMDESEHEDIKLWIEELLLEPIVKRFHYHFEQQGRYMLEYDLYRV